MDETISSQRTLGLIAGCLLLGQSVGAQSAERPATDPLAGWTAPAVVELRPVLVGPDKNSNVWPSPDGRWLAFTDPESGNLGVRSIPAGRDSLITHFASGTTIATGPAWSPDGLRLAYYWIDRVSKSTALRVVGRDGAVERIVYQKDGQYVEPWGWTPDGRQIVVSVRGEADPPRFALVSLDGVPIRFIKTVVTPYFVSLAVSPDGQYLAYDRPKETGSEDTDIFTLRIDGSSEVAVIEHPARDRLLGWMPDGRSLLFTSPRRKNVGSIWSVAVTEGRAAAPPELVRGAPANFEPLGVTRTGSLFYRLSTVMRDVYTASYDPTTGKAGRAELADAHDLSANTTGPDWSADGKYLLYQADVAGTGGHGSQLTIVSLSDGQRRQITPSVSDYSRPRWHPGGLSIVAHGAHLGEHGVYGIDATTGEAKSLVRWSGGTLLNPTWSPDGRTLFYERSGQSVMMREPGGEQREVFHATSGNALGTSAVSPDADWVAVIQTNDVARTNTLSVAPVAGGAARDLLAVKRPERLQVNPGALAWTADGRHLIFEKRVGSTYELWRIPVAGGAAERIGIGATRDIYFLRISPDGKRIAYVIGDVGENQWQVWEMKLGPLK